MSRYACDFETTTDPSDCRVWAFACCDIDTVYDCEDVVFGNSIDGFMRWLELCDKPRVWFHNLKFDGEFILNWLFDNGWEWVDDRRDLDALKFTTLISDMGQWYSIELEFANGTRARIQDSLKVVTMPVADIPAAFGLEDAKLELDYKGKREVGHVLTEAERAYVREDVVIVAKALHQMFEQGATKMTAGANALAAYKKSVGGGKRFRKIFPVPDYDAEVRRAYRGGFTYADPRFAGRDAGAGISFDVNSLYPAVMRYDPLPYGDPERFTGKPEPDARCPLYIVSVMIDAVVKPDHIPCIQVKEGMYADRFSPTEYVTDTKGPIARVVSSVDLDLIFEQYDVKSIEYFEGWRFKASTELFADFIDSAVQEKIDAAKHGNMGMRAMAKLKMNSTYGKFGTNPRHVSMRPHKEGGRVRFEKLPEVEEDGVYIPAAVFITAHARARTIRAAQSVYDRFMYADTDSLYLSGTEVPEQLDVDDYRLGAWKHEHTFQRFKALRAKTYVFVEDGELNVHCAGLPKRCHSYTPADGETVPDGCLTEVTFDNFEVGAKYWGKLFNSHVDGGIILYENYFTIR